jgi:hypothetical protein
MSTPSLPAPAAARSEGRPPDTAKPSAGRPGEPRPQRPPLTERSRDARQRAAAILEVLAGVRTPADAARALGVSLPRYYLLEEKALVGLVAACEPQPCGRRTDAARRCQALERECARWQRECARQQALVRAAQRSIGLAAPTPVPAKPTGKKRRSRRPTVRALQAVARLRPEEAPASPDVSTAPPVSS